MCGISGIWSKVPQRKAINGIIPFTNAIAHRGPDGFGYFEDEEENLAIGHRRLSILDLSNLGKQPMSVINKRFTITYNGEVFNFLELRKNLELLGWNFESNSDTEVVLKAYIQWGIDAFSRFNGMWALAIWDAIEKKLILCRDRFGIKPLFFLNNQECFAFSSFVTV